MIELKAIHTHVKSHYKKAMVKETKKGWELYSYGTKVASVDSEGNNLEIYNTQSLTTMRHLKDFINQYTNEYVSSNTDIRNLGDK